MPITHTLVERLAVRYSDAEASRHRHAGYYFYVAVPTCTLDTKSPLDPVGRGAAYRASAVYAAEHLARWRSADMHNKSTNVRAAFFAACTPFSSEVPCPS
jgi:hypothetical protein